MKNTNNQITALQDQWLIAQSKATPKTKVRMNKAAAVEKKKAEKEDKARKKAQSKNQSLDIRRLARNNSHGVEVCTFRNILSNLIDDPTSTGEPVGKPVTPIIPYLDVLRTVRRSFDQKAKTKSLALAGHLVAKGSANKLK